MPIFEYICKDCSRTFEALVMDSKQPECPACHGRHLEQLLSTFAPRASGAAPSGAPSPCGAGACASCPNAGMGGMMD
jgi:putative FmdB family regulatory protein